MIIHDTLKSIWSRCQCQNYNKTWIDYIIVNFIIVYTHDRLAHMIIEISAADEYQFYLSIFV